MQLDGVLRQFVASCRGIRLVSAVTSRAPFEARITFGRSSYFQTCLYSSSNILAARTFGYSAYDNIRKPPKRRTTQYSLPSHIRHDGASDSNNNNGTGRGLHRDDGWSARPTQSLSSRLHEAGRLFPETLKSGRYRQQHTGARRPYNEEASLAGPPLDRRFYRKVEDFREVQDDDPYAGVFGERASVKRLRVKEWQRQFEEENANLELPYERTNVLARLAPNWFVRYFLNLRDNGGMEHSGFLWACIFFLIGFLWLVGYLLYTPPSQARSIEEVR